MALKVADIARFPAKIWRWLIRPQPCLPPIPRDENIRGLGWAGDRREIRTWLAKTL